MRAALLMVLVVSLALVVELVLLGSLQHSAAQQKAFDRFRAELAQGTAPVGPLDGEGHVVPVGAPVAYLTIPSLGVKQVVAEGTTPSVLFTGPGHRRDTPLPGQPGVSVVFGRRATFGGPFRGIRQLKKGDTIEVTTGQGVFDYKVLGVRYAGDPVPQAPVAGASRLTLVTAAGSAFLPNGILRVDADLAGAAVAGPARLVSAANLPAEEQAMAGDARTLWALALWLQALIALVIGAVWAWHRWGHAQAWVVFTPALLLVGLAAAGEAARLLPNLS